MRSWQFDSALCYQISNMNSEKLVEALWEAINYIQLNCDHKPYCNNRRGITIFEDGRCTCGFDEELNRLKSVIEKYETSKSKNVSQEKALSKS